MGISKGETMDECFNKFKEVLNVKDTKKYILTSGGVNFVQHVGSFMVVVYSFLDEVFLLIEAPMMMFWLFSFSEPLLPLLK